MTFSIHTLGCKVNQYESGALSVLLRERGHRPADVGEEPDAVIVNSCTVTAVSDKKCRGLLRQLRRAHPGAVLAVCGCWSQVHATELHDILDLIGGTSERAGFVDALEARWADKTGDKPLTTVRPLSNTEALEALPSDAMGRTRAFLKVQDGCGNRCTYCIIPTARGGPRSRPLSAVLAEARSLAGSGFREMVVSGIEISAYRDGPLDVTDLISALCRDLPEVRFRLGSLEPTIADERFAASMAGLPNLCPHFHLALQSGCDKTLAAMGRRYTTAEYAEALSRLRKVLPHAAFTTDVIVGFPSESGDDFEQTLSFVRTCGFSKIHIFPYSRRPGTPAADMPGQLTAAEKADRVRRLGEVAAESGRTYRQALRGRVLSVLWETGDDGVLQGHSETYDLVRAPGQGRRGEIDHVRVDAVDGETLLGQIT